MYKPDYETARNEAGFKWYAYASYYTLLDLTGITLKEFNTSPSAGIELFRQENRRKIIEVFGDGIGLPALATPSVSYGHVNGLGLELVFPEGGGEVNYKHDEKSLDEYIGILQKDVDFSREGMAPFYIDYRDKLKQAYPGEKAVFNYGYEGPVTTAYELRGTNVFYDPYDEPEKFKKFLKYLTESIIKFVGFYSSANGEPYFRKNGASLCDDVAAMYSPSMWEEFVLPNWDQYYCGITDGKRRVHCEGLTASHMPFLERAMISEYDPGISPKLNPEIIRQKTRVPFEWRMGSFHLKDLEADEVEDWVYKTAADSASCIFTVIEAGMLDELTVKKVRTFVRTCKNVEAMLKEGADRKQISGMVSSNGREKFWKHWPEE